MRTNSILTITAITITSLGAAAYVGRDTAVPRQGQTAKPSLSSAASPNAPDTMTRAERRDQPMTPEQQRLTFLHEKVAALEARLRSMETTARELATAQTVSSLDTPEASNSAEKAQAKKLSETDLGQWLDDVLITGGFDREETRVTLEHLETSLAEAPSLNLADLQCGARFCRASFVPDNGEPPNIAHLFGASPFIEAGFTVPEPDGQVRVYFTQPGQSFSELRNEAQESVLRELPPE